MTRLSPSKPLRRQTDSKERGELLVVELFPRYMRIHVKNKHGGFDLTYEAAYDLARKIAARNSGGRP